MGLSDNLLLVPLTPPLAPGTNIRLLTLEPSRYFNSGIRCLLIELSFNRARGGYEALSYVRGSQIWDLKITCNDRLFYVTNHELLAGLAIIEKERKSTLLMGRCDLHWSIVECGAGTPSGANRRNVIVCEQCHYLAWRTVTGNQKGIPTCSQLLMSHTSSQESKNSHWCVLKNTSMDSSNTWFCLWLTVACGK